jgi:hypothetical protein
MATLGKAECGAQKMSLIIFHTMVEYRPHFEHLTTPFTLSSGSNEPNTFGEGQP